MSESNILSFTESNSYLPRLSTNNDICLTFMEFFWNLVKKRGVALSKDDSWVCFKSVRS